MRILVGCEESQAVTIAFRELGHEAYSCDLLPCSGGHPEWHIQMDILRVINGPGHKSGYVGNLLTQARTGVFIDKWDMGIFFPDCTYLTVTANKWLKDQPERKSGALVGQKRRDAREKAIKFFIDLYECDIPKIAMENPVGCISSVYRKPDQIITPMEFGHPEPKKTCLWLKGLPLLRPTHFGIEPEYHITESGKRLPKWYAYADKSKGQRERAKIRSKTFNGIAKAMADQWSNPVTEITTGQQQELFSKQ